MPRVTGRCLQQLVRPGYRGVVDLLGWGPGRWWNRWKEGEAAEVGRESPRSRAEGSQGR